MSALRIDLDHDRRGAGCAARRRSSASTRPRPDGSSTRTSTWPARSETARSSPLLLSVADLELDSPTSNARILGREEMASILDAGVRFESMLMANFGRSLAYRRDLTDPRVTYMLHEVGEETRHSRLFIRVISQLEPTAVNPFINRFYAMIDRRLTAWAIRHDALFMMMVLFGEEGPDLLQRLAVEDEATDPFVRDVNRYHRAEEARHLAYGRMVLGELFAEATFVERFAIRHLGPLAGAGIFDTLGAPGRLRHGGPSHLEDLERGSQVAEPHRAAPPGARPGVRRTGQGRRVPRRSPHPAWRKAIAPA